MVNINVRLPRPTKCDACESPNVSLVDNKAIYGVSKGEWPLVYLCGECEAVVSCHVNTDLPMGLMADRATRRLRSQAHKQFDKLWQDGLIDREKAYGELSNHLMLTADQCHIAMFDADKCKATIAFAKQRVRELKQLKAGFVYRKGQRSKRKY